MLLIEDEVFNELDPCRQFHPLANESAGVLLGYRRGCHIHVVQATLPAPGDLRSRFSFSRRDRSHQQIATREWRGSGRTKDYLGEWHTHPEATPTPSSVDISEWRSLCSKAKVPLIFVILGTAGNWYGIGYGAEMRPLQGLGEMNAASVEQTLGH
jgi:integrative and conjugative element protein (TIGR02256 family)